jgi:hypothetical protein
MVLVHDSCFLTYSPKGSGWLAQGNALGTRFADRWHAESVRQIKGRSACVSLLSGVPFGASTRFVGKARYTAVKGTPARFSALSNVACDALLMGSI